MKYFGRFFGQSPKNNNDIRLRRVEVLRSESAVVPVSPKEEREEKTGFACCLFVKIKICLFPDMRRHSDTLRGANAATKEGVNGGENGLSEAITRCRPRLNLSSRQFFTASTCLPLRRAVRCPILRPAAPARRLKRCRRIGGKGFCAVCIRTLTAKDLSCMN